MFGALLLAAKGPKPVASGTSVVVLRPAVRLLDHFSEPCQTMARGAGRGRRPPEFARANNQLEFSQEVGKVLLVAESLQRRPRLHHELEWVRKPRQVVVVTALTPCWSELRKAHTDPRLRFDRPGELVANADRDVRPIAPNLTSEPWLFINNNPARLPRYGTDLAASVLMCMRDSTSGPTVAFTLQWAKLIGMA
jgi:hypothetical protein